MIIKVNSLVLYKNKGAVVADIANDKYTIKTASGDRKSVRLKDIDFLHTGPCNAIPQPAALPAADLLLESVELMADDVMSFADFTELVFGADTPANALAAAELLTQNIYFKGSVAGGVQANSAEHINSILEKEKLKQAQADARAALLDRIKTNTVSPEDRPALREIENVAYGEASSSKLMHELNMEATPEKAQSLLLKLNIWNDFDNNPHLRRFEFNANPEYPALPELPEEERTDLTYMQAYAIDDAESNDPDDAINFDSENNLLWVHIADPAAIAIWDSELEQFACEQGCTSYLPEKITHMLPEGAVDIFGLGLTEISPALSFGIKIDNEGSAELAKLCLSKVKVQRCNYLQAEELMQSSEFAPCVEAIERFRQYRQNNNAVMIRLPEVKIKVNTAERTIRITELDRSPARELVANAMMAAGNAAAKFAVKHDFPLAFAVQSDPEMTERPETIPGMYELRKSCRVSTLSTIPGKHAGLGLEPYARVTSPLRRYEDLLNHIQLRKFLANQECLSISSMDERLATAEPAAVMRTKLERQCREYWT
ncbi:MAG: RNB domain-containing ribonuclease, partial [Lentisphaeria bacterium]|nr:RNB domain-containing ribonuclease [Lentisphaeria bacterium]